MISMLLSKRIKIAIVIILLIAEFIYPIALPSTVKKAAAATNTTVEQQINIITASSPGGLSTAGAADGIALIDTTNYTNATYYFDVNACVTSGTGTVVLTYNAGTGSTVSGGSTVTVSGVGPTCYTYQQYRSGTFTPTGIQNAYVSSMTGTNIIIRSARIIIVQSAPVITNTVTEFAIGTYQSITNTNDVVLGSVPLWTYNPAKFDGNVSIYFEADMTNSNAASTTTATLYVNAASCTTSVTGASVNMTGTTATRARSSNIAANLTIGTVYRLCLRTSANTGSIQNASIVIQQSSPLGLTKIEFQSLSVNIVCFLQTTTYTLCDYPFLFTPSDWTGDGTFTYYFGVSMSTDSGGTAEVELYNQTASAVLTGSQITTTLSTTNPGTFVSGSLTMPTTTTTFDTQIANTTGAKYTYLEDSWIVIDATNLPQNTVTATNASITLSNSNPSAVTTDVIAFTPADTTDNVQTIFLQYATTANGTTMPIGLSMSGTPTVTVNNNGTSLPNTATYASGLVTIVLTSATALIATGSAVSISIPSVTSPNAGSFYVQIITQGTSVKDLDYAVTAAETLTNVTLQLNVDPYLLFTVQGVASGTATGTTGAMNTTTATTTTSNIIFGGLNVGTNTASQLITTISNGSKGYTVTLQENQALSDGFSHTIANISANTTWSNGSTTGFGVNVTNATSGDTNTGSFSGNTKYQPIPVNATTLTLATTSGVTAVNGDSEYANFQIGIAVTTVDGNYANNLNYVVLAKF